MATEKVSRLIEKKRQSDTPLGFWRSETSSKQKTEEISVYNNFLIGTENGVTPSDRNLKYESTWQDFDEDAYNVTKGNMFCYELDETDYFDSEDEYWDNLRTKKSERNYVPTAILIICHVAYMITPHVRCLYNIEYIMMYITSR